MGVERECPSCHRVNRPGARFCDGCGFDFIINRPGRPRGGKSEDVRPGVFGLALGTIVHPVATMDSFFYYVSDNAMLGKMAIFYLVSLPISGLVAVGGESGAWVQGIVAEAAGFAVSLVCIVGVGRLLGQSGGLVSSAVILGFVRAVVTFVMCLYAIGIVIGLMPLSFLAILGFLIWNFVLNIVALTNIFGCSPGIAFFISLFSGFLQGVVTRALGVHA